MSKSKINLEFKKKAKAIKDEYYYYAQKFTIIIHATLLNIFLFSYQEYSTSLNKRMNPFVLHCIQH